MNLDGFRTVCVVGFSRSGIALVQLLLSLRKKVYVTECAAASHFPVSLVTRLQKGGVAFEFGGHSERFVTRADLVVVSPGVDAKKSGIEKFCHDRGRLLVGEIELASWLTPARIIAITGTNGKTTTSFLTYLILKSKKYRAYLAGNVGIPFSSYVLNTTSRDIIVLEVSSFQLETIISFRPFVSCLLNIEPDHLDRYSGFKEYFDAKKNIFRNQDKQGWAVLSKDMPGAREVAGSLKPRVRWFKDELINANYSAVYRMVNIFRATKADCLGVISRFKGLPHRMQIIRSINGISFINDSKATNPASTIWALKNLKAPVILIAGGKDKGLDYASLIPYLKSVKKINLIGEASAAIQSRLKDYVSIQVFGTLEDAVKNSFQEAKKNDTVLFSPMCSSFDMFLNYIQRGNIFAGIVNRLSGRS